MSCPTTRSFCTPQLTVDLYNVLSVRRIILPYTVYNLFDEMEAPVILSVLRRYIDPIISAVWHLVMQSDFCL